MMSDIKIVEEYDRPVHVVWKALTDPELVPLWTSTGQGGRPEDFRAEVGAKFKLVGKPFPGWDGIVRCEVLVAEEPNHLSYTWRNKEADDATVVSYLLDATPSGTRLTWEHTGFHGVEGFFMSRLLGRVRRKMLADGLPAALSQLDDEGSLKPQLA